ncbi:hypothetical protein ACET3X_006927 [Alternaria dauci]|uniref:Uncharacterized protein n=1 Tax=Alternaria dauci TaxID=48095 RepID=A0ABR3UHS8_9PLEO
MSSEIQPNDRLVTDGGRQTEALLDNPEYWAKWRYIERHLEEANRVASIVNHVPATSAQQRPTRTSSQSQNTPSSHQSTSNTSS